MPDEIVEKVARAIYEARGAHEPPRAWRKWEDIGDEAVTAQPSSNSGNGTV